MLPIHEHIVGELVQEDGVVVIGAGLGLAKILASMLRLHARVDGVAFVLCASDSQRNAIKAEMLEQDPSAILPVDINNEYTAADRLSFYSEGGSAFVTSRILIVELLNERVPLHRVAGLVFLNAHRLSETCTEAFIARLYRTGNRKGFVRAFSDKPQAMVTGFSKAEKIMRSLYVRKLHLWPRFHMSIAAALEENPPAVIDLRVPLTPNMQGINASILEVMDACLKELRKTNKVDIEDLTLENGLFKSFDEIVRHQLDPIWHTLGKKTKQLVSDLKTLRKLANYLVRYDAITFLKYLDSLRASEDFRSVWIFANPTHKIFELAKKRVFQVIRASDDKNTLVAERNNANNNKDIAIGAAVKAGKQRKVTHGSVNSDKLGLGADDVGAMTGLSNKQGVEIMVMAEEMPKWKVLDEVLKEIREELQHWKSTVTDMTDCMNAAFHDCMGIILIACKDERTCLQLQDCINNGSLKLMSEEWEKYLLGKTELHGMRTRKKRKPSTSKGVGILNGGKNAVEVTGSSSKQEEAALLAAATKLTTLEARGGRIRSEGRGRGRCRQRGRLGRMSHKDDNTDFSVSSSVEDPSLLPNDTSSYVAFGGRNVRTEESLEELGNVLPEMRKPCLPMHFYALEREQRIMDILKPSFVILYDPDMAFVRQIEIYKAENPLKSLKVYFLFYDNSVETQKFESSIQRENSAFESLIRQKASMMIPMDQDGRLLETITNSQSPNVSSNSVTRKAGGRKGTEKQMQIVVDMREFGSSLPCVLHQQGMRILPVVLEVGDYILSPDICMERKSVSDLFASFASGRLYHQVETMTRYYKIPVLLIEFSQDKSFSFQSANDVGEDILPTNIVSKLSLLVLHFPRLRIVWSRSLHATAEIFFTLKSNQEEPDIDMAMRVGVPTEDGFIEGDLRAENFNTTAVELLRRLPGVTDSNYRTLMDNSHSLVELACLPFENLAELMGGQRPARMLRDFLDAKCPAPV